MTSNFFVLAFALTALVMLFVAFLEGAVKVGRFGNSWLISNRDRSLTDDPSVYRANRAKINTLEAMAMFIPALAAAAHSGSIGWLGQLSVFVFLGARVAYPFAYLAGTPALRTSIWAVGLFATTLIAVGAFIG